MATTKAARRATSVLPKPTSPQISRSIGLPADRSSSTSSMALSWSSVSSYGKRAQNSSNRPCGGSTALGVLGGARGGDADQALGHLAQAFLGPRLARLPGRAAQPVELHALVVRAVAGQQVDVLDRQVELGLAAVLQLQAVVRRALDVQGLQALVAADAVVDVDDEVARGQRRGLGQEVRRPPALARPRQPVAQDVGLGDDRQVVGLEARRPAAAPRAGASWDRPPWRRPSRARAARSSGRGRPACAPSRSDEPSDHEANSTRLPAGRQRAWRGRRWPRTG